MKTAIVGSFVFLGAYALAVLIGWYATALFLFSVSPLVVLYVVYKVLRDPQEVTQTFDQHFYQDHPYQRNQG
ncbi:MAG: hypothetical protein RI565_06945 [Schleiferiaceae bacterium]|nr:hypothetical protein [Schleiferiaceae bacterium]